MPPKREATEIDLLRVKLLADLVVALSALPTSLRGIGLQPDGTKACVIADAGGRAVAFSLAPGQAHELPQAISLLARLPRVPRWVVADRGTTSHAFRTYICNLGSRPAIPPQRHEAPVACPPGIYHH